MGNNTKMPVWPGPRIMVPMPTDILLLGRPDQNQDGSWASTGNSYYNLFEGLTPDSPKPFSDISPPGVGAHLMWTLPYSLRSGAQTTAAGDADAKFPLVPNRWLVTRFAYTTAGEAPTIHAMVVESDNLYDISSKPNAHNQYPYPEDTSFPIRGIGQSVDLTDWEGTAAPASPFLQAVGPGDVAWAVGYDNIKDVFSLYDPLNDDVTTYTYSIIGWYANPEDDLLYNIPTNDPDNCPTDWQNALKSLYKWSVGKGCAAVEDAQQAWLDWQKAHGLDGTWDPSSINLPAQAKAAIIAWHTWQQTNGSTEAEPNLPRQILCQSMVATVDWQGGGHAYGTGAPGGGLKYPQLAVGNSSIEAISTFMAHVVSDELKQGKDNIPDIQRTLEAFQKDLIFDLVKDPIKVENLLHNTSFSNHYQGQKWVVVRPESTEDDITDNAGQFSIPLSDDNTKKLTALNTLQEEVNELLALIQSQQAELFMLKFKERTYPRGTPQSIIDAISNSISAISAALTENIGNQQTKQQTVDTNATDFQTDIDATKFIVKAIDLPGFAAPNDPVIMVSGGQLDTKFSEPGIYEENTELFVRFTGQTVTGIEVAYDIDGNSDSILIDATAILDAIQLPTWNAIPKETMDLWVETLILDTSNAQLIAGLYFKARSVSPTKAQLSALTAQVQTWQTAIWNHGDALGVDQQTLKEVAGIQGVVPSVSAVSFRTGQPWSPVFMDWEVRWYPTSMEASGALTNWTFGEIDYEWEGSTIPEPQTPLIFEGRSILNAKTAQNIKEKFETFELDPNYDGLPDFLKTDLQVVADNIGKLDVVAQSMSGFTKQLTTQLSSMNQFPGEEVSALLGNNGEYYRPVGGNVDATNSEPFFPLRSGHFEITNLWVVDSFGQILRGKDPSAGAASPIANIWWSENLTTSSPNFSGKSENYGQLSPRLSEFAKANASLLQADDDTIKTNSSDLTSPVCGFVMPNHLDNSLMVFDASGNSLGAILKVQREVTDPQKGLTQEFSIRWENTPGTNSALGAPPKIDNEHLNDFILSLLSTAYKGAGAYDDLMSVIDSTLWTMSNFENQNGNLSILLGRPLAVVRGEVSMGISGTPIYNQTWKDTGQYYDNNGQYDPQNPPYMDVPFHIRLGDSQLMNNGVMGYFESGNYDVFNAVYGIGGQTSNLKTSMASGAALKGSFTSLSMTTGSENELKSGYIVENHLIEVKPNNESVKVTMLVDPSGNIPIIPASLPSFSVALPTGPVTDAISNLKATFRAGPLLLDPKKIKMPTPAEVRGEWGWLSRQDVTSWNEEVPVGTYTPVATMNTNTPKLIDGWLTLSGAEDKK